MILLVDLRDTLNQSNNLGRYIEMAKCCECGKKMKPLKTTLMGKQIHTKCLVDSITRRPKKEEG